MSRKMIIVIGAVLVFAVVIIAVLFLFRKQQLSPNGSALNQGNNSLGSSIPRNSGSSRYQTQLFTFVAPNNAKITQGGNTTEGIITTYNAGSDTDLNTIEVEAIPVGKAQVSEVGDLFKSRGFSEGNVTINGNIPAKQYTGSMSFSSQGLQEIATVFEWNNYVYKIQLMYKASSVDPVKVQNYQQFLSSFKPI